MATVTQRVTAILDAILNTTTTAQQKTDIAEAFITVFRQDIIDSGYNPDALTVDQKAHYMLIRFRRLLKEIYARSAYKEVVDGAESTALTAKTAAETEIGDEVLT